MLDDSNAYIVYGTPLPELENDEYVKIKPIRQEEQTATDEKGRRRFHGAFTGGFSAGYFNTVGSEEGFTPSTFLSSRTERQRGYEQKATDFMDDEDRSDYGIAPKRVKLANEFKLTHHTDTLEACLGIKPLNLGSKLLARLGVKRVRGGIGPLVTIEETSNNEKVYGCARPPEGYDLKSSADFDLSNLKYLSIEPDDVEVVLPTIVKDDVFGLGYKPLNSKNFIEKGGQEASASAVELFGKKKEIVGMQGEAFGVGCYEEEDDDIYAVDDLSKYDVELSSSKCEEKRVGHLIGMGVSAGFSKASKDSYTKKKIYKGLDPPLDFTGRHVMEKSSSVSSHKVDVKLEDERKKKTSVFDFIPESEKQKLLDAKKQLELNREAITDPVKLSSSIEDQENSEKRLLEWKQDQEQEVKNRGLFTKQNVNSRFISAGALDSLQSTGMFSANEKTPQQIAANDMNFGKLTRSIDPFYPSLLLCRRFNVEDPYHGMRSGDLPVPSVSVKKPVQIQKVLSFLNESVPPKPCPSKTDALVEVKRKEPEPPQKSSENAQKVPVRKPSEEKEKNGDNSNPNVGVLSDDVNLKVPSLDLLSSIFGNSSDDEESLEESTELSYPEPIKPKLFDFKGLNDDEKEEKSVDDTLPTQDECSADKVDKESVDQDCYGPILPAQVNFQYYIESKHNKKKKKIHSKKEKKFKKKKKRKKTYSSSSISSNDSN